MLRREVLKILAAFPFMRPRPTLFGWKENRESLERYIREHKNPFVAQQNPQIIGTGAGKKVLLHPFLERLTGPFRPHNQAIGDCVSHGFSLGVDMLMATQIVMMNKPQIWKGFTASEPIYGGSRVEIGHYSGGDGSTGHWAAEWLSRYGILLRRKYPGWDFRRYNGKTAARLGDLGCPDELEPTAKLHPVRTTAICTSYSEARDCIANGYPVAVCSNVGFGEGHCRRDREGFLKRRAWPWNHCMLFGGMDDTKRPGLLCFNSWGTDWISGPKREQPEGTFWVDADTADDMLKQGDSFALSHLVGFPHNPIPYVFR